jgi:chemotaxis protein methyltransferase CheR
MNLQESFAALGMFDLILCRNVMIYFAEPFKIDLLDRFASALAPHGSFMLGAAETILGLPHRFTRMTNDDSVFYRVKEE